MKLVPSALVAAAFASSASASDAPVLTATANLRASCGKYTAGTAAAQAGVNIVNDIWQSNGEICRYATRQFKGDVESALLNEFPDNCRDNGAYDANQSGRRAGENYMNKIISDCSQPVPPPTQPPVQAGCGKYTAGTAAAQAGVNIVNDIWQSNGKSCSYATRQFTGDVESALLNEFPDNCRDTGAYDANASGRRAGENYMNRIISDCSQPVPPPTQPPVQAGCGKYTAGTAAAQAGVNIVNGLWLDSGKDCRYATRQFKGDVESALLKEFPDNCRDTGAYDANASGRRAGENYMNRIISDCSQPVPRPTPPPRRPTYPPTWPTLPPSWPTRPPTGRVTDRDIRNACGYVKNCNGCKKQCPSGAIKDACKAQHCNGEDWLEDELEETMSE